MDTRQYLSSIGSGSRRTHQYIGMIFRPLHPTWGPKNQNRIVPVLGSCVFGCGLVMVPIKVSVSSVVSLKVY